jgi:hypothetical protein
VSPFQWVLICRFMRAVLVLLSGSRGNTMLFRLDQADQRETRETRNLIDAEIAEANKK